MANNSVINSGKITKVRENNYDLLRIISTFAVILIHVNAFYISKMTDYASNLYWIGSAINIVTRFSVPCFVMLSGAFLLSNPKNKDYKTFYKKTFSKIFLPFIVISILLFLFSEGSRIISHASLWPPLEKILIGDYYNLWFMFMLFGLYIFVPIIIRVKESVTNKSYCIAAVIWLIFSIINQLTTAYKLSYAFGVVFSYMGYFIVGNVIYENLRGKKNAIVFFILSMACFSVTFIYRYFTGSSYYSYSKYASFFVPFVALGSLCIFIAFSNIKINRSFAKLSSRTFYIYMFHTVIYYAILNLIKDRIPLNSLIMMLLVTVVTFLLAWFASVIFMKIWSFCENKIKDRGRTD
mgnify:CR=1 FL=1